VDRGRCESIDKPCCPADEEAACFTEAETGDSFLYCQPNNTCERCPSAACTDDSTCETAWGQTCNTTAGFCEPSCNPAAEYCSINDGCVCRPWGP
jgi:hypothetical protein